MKNIFGYSLIPSEFLTSSLETIAKWLNRFVLSSQLLRFPDDVIASQGSQLFDLYAYLSGKVFSQKAQLDLPLKKAEKLDALLKQYDAFLKTLMSEGALLSTIRPYYLLSFSEFNQYLRLFPLSYTNSSCRPTMAQFSYLSADCWITLFYQIIKVYYLSRITPKSFKKQFPAQKLPEFYLEDSNVYSISEAILLRWIELYQKDAEFRLASFDGQLKDSLCLSAVIQGYINTPTIRAILNLKPACQSSEDFLYNAEKVLQALSFIGLETHVQAKNLATPSARENLLFLIHIYQSLLNYIPKEAPIVFKCVLGQYIVKNIELRNPTRKFISYWVKFEGNQDFSIGEDSLRIEPLGKIEFQVKFQSRISEPVTGRLTFFNKRESNINAAAIVFDLRSEITERVSLEVINLQAQLYQTKQEIITIKNIFMNSSLEFADFTINLLIDKIPKIEKKEKNEKNAKNEKNDKNAKNEKNAKNAKNEKNAKNAKNEKNAKNAKNEKNVKNDKKSRSSSAKKEKNPDNFRKSIHNFDSPMSQNSVSSPRMSHLKVQTESRDQILSFLMPTFICSKEKLHLRKGESQQISLIFLPMFYEDYRCRLICCDKEVGEFQLEILAETLMPEVLCDIKPGQSNPIYVETITKFDCPLSFRNDNLNSAKKFHENRLASTARYKENIIKFKQNTQNPDEILFKVELSPPSPFIVLPATFLMKGPSKALSVSSPLLSASPLIHKRNSEEESQLELAIPTDNRLSLEFQYKFPLASQAHNLILRSADNSDIRIYRLLVSVSPKTIKGTIKLKCAFGDELKQEIPFINNTDKDWVIKSNLAWDQMKYPSLFAGSRDLTVKRKSSANFLLVFRPVNPLEKYEGKLAIINTTTNDHYDYDLLGLTEDPLAKGHIVIRCIAQTAEKRLIDIMNPYKDRPVSYLIETDLINVIGLSKITIEAGKVHKYSLAVNPLIGGVYTGSITFYEEGDREKYVWYTVSVETNRSKSKGELEIRAEIRKTVSCDIELYNPLEENLTFEAIIEGEGLMGDSFITIPAKKSILYKLEFLPLKDFAKNGSISFINEKIGEVWYELHLVSAERKAEKLALIKAELGKSKDITVFLENPSLEPASVKSQLSNPSNFSIYPDNLQIPALQELEITIRYTPSDLEKPENSELLFESDTIGKWRFSLAGIGSPPDKFTGISISCPVDKDLTRIVNFRNPLKSDISVLILLKQEQEDGGFRLMMATKARVVIAGLTNYQIPYLFQPKGIREYECEIIVHLNDRMQWVFPIKGLGEYVMSDFSYSFKAKSREIFAGDLKLAMPGIVESFLKKPFNLTIDQIPEEFSDAIQRCLKISPLKNTMNSLEDFLKFKVIFSPMKPFKVALDMLLTTNAGGRWK